MTPYFRHVVLRASAPLAQEAWWAAQPLHTDLDLFLAAHLASPHSARRPLVVLGHPGAGKSLLTRVLAARLPVATYTAIWVPLRHVKADTQIHHQIEEALYTTTNGRVSWPALVEETADDTVRVVILDGLDELIQASGASQSRYLQEIEQFQEREMILGKPVAVIVTSRVVVADRVEIPDGSSVIKLEDFTDVQVNQWLQVWNATNRGTEGFRPLRPAHAIALPALARQPLLLLMLALYTADAQVPDLTEMRSSADLYGKLVDNFIRREIIKDAETPAGRGINVAKAVAPRRFQLAIAAFAMFNRGRQYVTEPELQQDLESLLGSAPQERRSFAEPLNHAAKMVGQFFFVHAPSADDGNDARGGLHRTYEFLHATFGEYLIAAAVMGLLRRLAERRAQERDEQAPYLEVLDDAKLCGLLSHQVLAGRASILDLAAEHAHHLRGEDLSGICAVIDELLRDIRTRTLTTTVRPEQGALPYDPSRNDASTRLAMYSCNLVALRLMLADTSGVPISCFADLSAWRFLVSLWRGCFDEDSWRAVMVLMTTEPTGPELAAPAPVLKLRGRDADGAEHDQRFYGFQDARLFADYDGLAIMRGALASWGGRSPANATDAEIHSRLLQFHHTANDDVPFEFDEARPLWADLSPPTRRLLLTALADEAPVLPLDTVRSFDDVLGELTDPRLLLPLAGIAAAHPAMIATLLPVMQRMAHRVHRRVGLAAAAALVGAAQLTTQQDEAAALRRAAAEIRI
ncbi:hypothetical protein AB0M46_41520 [Dactylosporangium sp. NPDC051485]|uniref:NACHT domain-containing protein n=1 Tax=Dactylosporangium sp. NPDC051485 TaxID=3154846 RepID=UPI003449C5E0